MKLKQNKQSKLVVALSAVILLLVALSATLTFAYFTAQDEKSSADVKFGQLEVSLKQGENDNDALKLYKDGTETELTNSSLLVPGCSIQLASNAKIKVTTNIATLLRVKFVATYKNSDTDASFADFNSGLISVSLPNENGSTAWVSHTDGYIYYTEDLSTNADLVISKLALTFSEDLIGNEYKGKTVKITLSVEAIQKEHTFTGSTMDATSIAAAFAKYSADGVVQN